MIFFKDFLSSIYNPVNYPKYKNLSFWAVIWYLIRVVLVLSLFVTIFLSFKVVPVLSGLSSYLVNGVSQNFPAELKVDIKNGQVSTNVPEPYFVPVPKDVDDKKAIDLGLTNFIVIDTKNDQSLEKFASYKTFLWVGRNSIMYQESNKKITIQPIGKMDFSVDRATVVKMLESLRPFIKMLTPIVIVFIFFGIASFKILGTLFYLLIISLVLLLICKLARWSYSYKEIYKMSIYAYSWPLFISLFTLTGLVPGITFLPSLILVIIFFANLSQLKRG